MSAEIGNVTRLLAEWGEGKEDALDELLPLVKEELQRSAARFMRKEGPGHTLQATALINELFLKLAEKRSVSWKNRAHFFGAAATMMRNILVDHARIKKARKRNDGEKPLGLDEARDAYQQRSVDLVALDDALRDLEKLSSRQSRAVELHYFSGLSQKEIGEILGVAERTIKRDLQAARLWLFEYLRGVSTPESEAVAASSL